MCSEYRIRIVGTIIYLTINVSTASHENEQFSCTFPDTNIKLIRDNMCYMSINE